MVHPGCFPSAKEAWDIGHVVEVGPQATHRVVTGRRNTHWCLIRGFTDGFFVHLDQVAVALLDHVLTEALDGVA